MDPVPQQMSNNVVSGVGLAKSATAMYSSSAAGVLICKKKKKTSHCTFGASSWPSILSHFLTGANVKN
jgi:hypothetical protein